MIIFIDVHFPLLQLLSETLQAAIPNRISISALNIILLPAFESGFSTDIVPSLSIFEYINRLIG